MRALVFAATIACGPAATPAPEGPPLILRLDSIDGQPLDFTELRGAPVVVHLFTTWSPPGTADADHLQRLHASGRVRVVGVALDDGGVPGAVAAWRRATGVSYPLVRATPEVRSGRSVLGSAKQVPVTLLYDARGRPLRRWERALDDAVIAELRAAAGLD